MKSREIGYWTTTGLIATGMTFGGIVDLLSPPQAVEQLEALGYPAYMLPMLGAWKVLGALAVLAPRTARLKEWAYAGFTFDLVGAAVSHAAVSDPAEKVIIPLVFLALVFASWWLRPESRRLASPSEPVRAPLNPPQGATRPA